MCQFWLECLMLNLLPNVTHQEGVDCANLELVFMITMRLFVTKTALTKWCWCSCNDIKYLSSVLRMGPLCQCHVPQKASQWVHLLLTLDQTKIVNLFSLKCGKKNTNLAKCEGVHDGGKLGEAKTNVSDSSRRIPYLHPATKKVKKK